MKYRIDVEVGGHYTNTAPRRWKPRQYLKGVGLVEGRNKAEALTAFKEAHSEYRGRTLRVCSVGKQGDVSPGRKCGIASCRNEATHVALCRRYDYYGGHSVRYRRCADHIGRFQTSDLIEILPI